MDDEEYAGQDGSNINGAPTVDFEYRFGASIYPIFDVECDRVSRVLLFGGIDLRKPFGATKDVVEGKKDGGGKRSLPFA